LNDLFSDRNFENVKIADISFAFKNHSVMKLLAKRGEYIKNGEVKITY
jgi:hypothetical protein